MAGGRLPKQPGKEQAMRIIDGFGAAIELLASTG
jgi:hypothetical protein